MAMMMMHFASQQEEEEDECSGVPTPPDSPNTAARERATSNGAIDPDVEIYAIESNESKFYMIVFSNFCFVLFKISIKVKMQFNTKESL